MNCENCKSETIEKYGSGRFCSSKCARGFSTKAKRKEINEKVSIIARTKPNSKIASLPRIGICRVCSKSFDIFVRHKSLCSRECKGAFYSNCLKGITPKTGVNRKPGSGGIRNRGGWCKKLFTYTSIFNEEMTLNKEEIEIAKILDSSGLKWIRNTQGFAYTTDKVRKFHPDFYLTDLNVYVEYKGFILDEMRLKMKLAIKENSNLNLIVVMSDRHKITTDGIYIDEFVRQLAHMKFDSMTDWLGA